MTANAIRLARAFALVAFAFLAFDLGASALSTRTVIPESATPVARVLSTEMTEMGRFVVTPTTMRYTETTAGAAK